MIDHLSLGSKLYPEAVTFYSTVLVPLGADLLRDTGSEAAFGTPERWSFFIYPADAAANVIGDRTHVAFSAASRDAVRRVYAAAIGSGGADILSPRERPEISPTYFGAMFSDLDGHRIEVLTNEA
jgi:catechol 2,3-dioxygenase-like lactoylglutathione lyase family enzyme